MSLHKHLSIEENDSAYFCLSGIFTPELVNLKKYCLFSRLGLLGACWLPQLVWLHILNSDMAILNKEIKNVAK